MDLNEGAGKDGEELLEAVRGYLDGTDDGTAITYCGEQQIISKAEPVCRKHSVAENPKATYINAWGFPYEIRAERAMAELMYLRTEDGRLIRFVRAEFQRPEGLGTLADGCWSDMTDCEPWGFPGMLICDEEARTLTAGLAYAEREFASEAEMLADMESPAEIDYKGFFDDYYGDG